MDARPAPVHTTRRPGPTDAHGLPGSGKTTLLWKAVDARSDQCALYMTWSRELTTVAEEHFQAFVLADVRVEARDFRHPAGGRRRSRPGDAELALLKVAEHVGPDAFVLIFPGLAARRLSGGCGTTSCGKGSLISTASWSTRCRT